MEPTEREEWGEVANELSTYAYASLRLRPAKRLRNPDLSRSHTSLTQHEQFPLLRGRRWTQGEERQVNT
ncbi:hypothetical protein CC80DRAFT_490301 [Byssothecium circinans]|uniref:Uncharacterized protein n=1 Tax=Byssothecium circinans TaxID=147558 RepID=A0A6A5U5W3_9PLEO|nr:hypothetical protein CC80DRAFT_490301 [Byssothecium circinans]